MSEAPKINVRLEIAHVLFIDIVGYSIRRTDEQQALVDQLNKVVRSSDEFSRAAAAGRLKKIPTGDGMALIFHDSPEQPVECAVEISRVLKHHPDLPVRMGVHSGPVSEVMDVNGRVNAAGIGINVAQRLMDCGDAGHILLSKRVAEDLQQNGRWRPHLRDLSKVSALHVVSRNTAFTFKGKPVDVRQVASQLNVSHVLEGSVRKAGGRVRITSQLIDGSNDSHIWAERYDRDLHDIFALQDEISHAIVDALKVKLLPEEKKAIEHRGTDNIDAYNLYLMARQTYTTGFEGDIRLNEAIIRLCRRAVEIDPNYAEAWALIAMAEMLLRSTVGRGGDGGLAAAERALELNADLAEAHAVKARILSEERRHDEASREIETALRLDPESHQVNKCAALLRFRQQQLDESIRHFEKAIALEEGDFGSAGMLITCYTALGNREAARRAAEITLARAERVLAHDRNNGSAMGHGSDALAVLGQRERAKDWMGRALLIDPENITARYNFVCALANHLNDKEAALEMLGPAFEKMGTGLINHAKIDPDFDCIRDDPRFKAMVEAAERRLGIQPKRE